MLNRSRMVQIALCTGGTYGVSRVIDGKWPPDSHLKYDIPACLATAAIRGKYVSKQSWFEATRWNFKWGGIKFLRSIPIVRNWTKKWIADKIVDSIVKGAGQLGVIWSPVIAAEVLKKQIPETQAESLPVDAR